jgi:hypothetical protein
VTATSTATATATSTNTATPTVTVTIHYQCCVTRESGANGRTATDRLVQVDRVWLQLGNFKVGYDSSVYGIGTTQAGRAELDDRRLRRGDRHRRSTRPLGLASAALLHLAGSGGQPHRRAEVGHLGPVRRPVGSPDPEWCRRHTIPKEWSGGVVSKATINTPGIAKGDQLSFAGSVGTGCAFISNNCGKRHRE